MRFNIVGAAGFAAFACLSAASAPAGPLPGLKIAGMEGQCTRLVTRGEDRTAKCDPLLLNNIYDNGRSSFLFFTQNKEAIVSFLGNDSKAQGDTGTLKVTQVYMTGFDGKPVPHEMGATGSCTYTNPYKGVARVDCKAGSGDNQFEASFVSNGQPPNVFG